MHDPLAISTLFIDVCKFEKENIFVGLEGAERAVTLIDKRGLVINYAKEVDVDAFFKYFLSTFFKI